jgi:hypothetical protein
VGVAAKDERSVAVVVAGNGGVALELGIHTHTV